jgi:hypothetical protein
VGWNPGSVPSRQELFVELSAENAEWEAAELWDLDPEKIVHADQARKVFGLPSEGPFVGKVWLNTNAIDFEGAGMPLGIHGGLKRLIECYEEMKRLNSYSDA